MANFFPENLQNSLCENKITREKKLFNPSLKFFKQLGSQRLCTRPRTNSLCYHGNKSAATFKKGIFVHPPKCLTALKILRRGCKFLFPSCLILTETSS